MKLRRFDLYPDDMIAGMIELTNDERGVFATAIVAIYSHAAPITFDHLRRLCPGHARTHQRIVARLVELNKLCVTEDGKLTQKRCEKEIKNACKRLETLQENGRKGGRGSRNNNDIAKPTGSPRARAREGVAKTTTTFKKEIGDDGLGRSAPPGSPISEDEIKAVGELVSQATRVLGQPKKIIRDPEAYGEAIEQSVWNAWLNRLSRYVMSEFDAQVSMPKLEAIEQARAAGSRRVTDPAVRKILNEIAREIAARERGGRAAA